MAVGRPNLKTYTGNRILVEFEGAVIGLVQSVRVNDSYALESASGVGDIHTVEFVPTIAQHSVSVSNMTLFTGNMRDAGIAVENGQDALRGLIFDIVIYGNTGEMATATLGPNGVPGATPPVRGTARLRTIVGCSFDSGDIEISAHRIVMQSAQFKALDVVGTGI